MSFVSIVIDSKCTMAAARVRGAMTALVFPGQGSQRVGMAQKLLDNWPQLVRATWEEASEATGTDLLHLALDGPQDKLTQTQYAQPAILTQSIATLRVLQAEMGITVDDSSSCLVLGHSLGEYSALVAAQALSFADAVNLVHQRGKAMQHAVAEGVGAMAALMPIDGDKAELVCRETLAEFPEAVCQVANYNSSKQVVISGSRDAVTRATEIAKGKYRVRRAVLLDVSAPFHCALMAPAAEQFVTSLRAVSSWQPAQVPVVWNTEAQGTIKDVDAMQQALVQQITEPVRWSQSVDWCLANGVERFVEVGFGGVLTGLIKQHAPKASARSAGDADELIALIRENSG